MNNRRNIEYASDLDGTALVRVPVGTQDATCTIERADYDFLIKNGLSPHWGVSNGKYVSAIKNGKREYVARLMCMTSGGQSIRYKDGNPFNLRRSNLQVMEKRPAPMTFAATVGEAA